MSEKRIYVVIPEVVYNLNDGKVIQPLGRQIAQACHVTAKLRHDQDLDNVDPDIDGRAYPYYRDITTIILSARNEKEVVHVANLLKNRGVFSSFFYDENDEVYGKGARVLTAMAAYAEPIITEGVLDYLPLWGAQ